MVETSLLGQRTVFIRGGQAIGDLFASAALKRYSPSIVALVNELSQ